MSWDEDRPGPNEVRQLRAQLERAERERDSNRRLVREIVEEWNEPCEPSCSADDHADNCRAIHIAEAKRALRTAVLDLAGALEKIAGQLWHNAPTEVDIARQALARNAQLLTELKSRERP